jgi:hypothetical protein
MTRLSGPICSTILSAAFVFTTIFLAFWLPARKISHLMDPGDKPGAFEPHIKRYQELARLVLTLATASAAFLIGLVINPPERHAPSDAAAKLLNAAPQAILFLCATAFFLLLFMTLLNFFYENYSHFHYLPETHTEKKRGTGEYRRWKYALVLSLGYSGLLGFFSAYAWLAHSLFRD